MHFGIWLRGTYAHAVILASCLAVDPQGEQSDLQLYCYYKIVASWDEAKRRNNLRKHGLDFVGSDAIWDNFTVTREDVRENYGEVRLVTFGALRGAVVVLVHTDRDGEMHVISLRKAEAYEARYYLEAAEAYFDQSRGR